MIARMFLLEDVILENSVSNPVLAQNRRATYDYVLHDTFEAGIVLLGSEVKSLRAHQCSLAEAYVIEKDGELFLQGVHISEYKPAFPFGHEPKRLRKLLLKKRQIARLIGRVSRRGETIVPTKVYLSSRGMIKVEIALATGKTNIDRRETIKERDWKRQKQRILKTTV